MFSPGHIIWIIISIILIIIGLSVCLKRKPKLDHLVKICLILGAVSEIVKILFVVKIVPVLQSPIINPDGTFTTVPGAFTPYIEMEHMPFELCSLQLVFMAVSLMMDKGKWKTRLYSLMYLTSVVGGTIALLLSSIAPEYSTTASFLLSPRAWQFFLYHAMIITLGIYIAFSEESGVGFRHIYSAFSGLLAIDLMTYYINSIFSQPVYYNEELVGVSYRVNYFSSYGNPLRIPMTTKPQWVTYLLIRLSLALILLVLAFLPLRRKQIPAQD